MPCLNLESNFGLDMKPTVILSSFHVLLGHLWIALLLMSLAIYQERVPGGWWILLNPLVAGIYLIAGHFLFKKSQAHLESEEYIRVTLLSVMNTFLSLTWFMTLIYMILLNGLVVFVAVTVANVQWLNRFL